jgi:RNA polymerase sigma factor (TIGR02999 family)
MREYVSDRDSSNPVMPLSVSHRWRPNQLIPEMTDVKPPDTSVTGLLQSVQRGDRDALSALFPLVYQELRVLARGQRRNWHGASTLNATALVHEAYIKLVDQNAIVPESRSHFFAVAAKAMRHILCNYARDRQRLKRGGGVEHVPIRDELDALPISVADEEAEQLAALDEALERLGQLNERQAQVVECRFFAGMNIEETAAALGLSPATVKRDWTMARAWLFREIQKR